MIYYDVIVELMNIHEIICKLSNQAISGTSHDNLVRFSANSSFYQCLLQCLVFFHLGFWSGNLFLIAPFPALCLLVPFFNFTKYKP